MTLSRHAFFLLLLTIILLPLPVYKLVWLAGSREKMGTFYFTGHGNLGSALGISTYPVVWFRHGNDTVFFNGNVNIPLKPNERVSVRYQKNYPSDAKVNSLVCIWGDTLAYELGPMLIFLIVFFHPDLVPRKAKISLQWKTGIRFLNSQ